MPEPLTILAVDDEATMRRVLQRTLTGAGYRVETCNDGRAARERLRQGGVDLIVTDLMMPGLDGFALLEEVRKVAPETIVIVITAFSSVESAVRAMKLGARDFLPKPFDPDHLLLVIERAVENRQLRRENLDLRKVLAERDGGERLIGVSPAIGRVRQLIDKVARTDATVLIAGESGTGKELVARAIHAASGRATASFVPINCGALPDELLESELFGYEKGAFSGAVARKLGLLQLADRGTLFLDEVGTVSPMMQVKLLRFLQDRSFMRLGGSELVRVDVRVLAATNEDLAGAVRAGTFRRDLYYRLHVVTIAVEPLRERREDIQLLCRHFLDRHAKRSGKDVRAIDGEAMAALMAHRWEGNVRELENAVECAVTLCDGATVTCADLPASIRGADVSAPCCFTPPELSLAEVEEQHIRRVLAHVGGNKSLAARILGIDYTTLLRKLKMQAADGDDGGGRSG